MKPKQMPVAWRFKVGIDNKMYQRDKWHLRPHNVTGPDVEVQPLYTAPPQREWQGLTKQDWHEIWEQFDESSWDIDEEFQKEMVAKHGEAYYHIEPEEDWKRQKVLIEKLVEAKLKEKNNAV